MKYDKLDLGCSNKKPEGYIGVDINDFFYPKDEFVKCDINNRLPFNDNAFIEVRALQVIEHIRNDNKVNFLNEVYRILKVGGLFIAEFPPPMGADGNMSASYFTDPTHCAWWMPGTFWCFCASFRANEKEHEQAYVKGYGIKTNFEMHNYSWINNELFHVELKRY